MDLKGVDIRGREEAASLLGCCQGLLDAKDSGGEGVDVVVLGKDAGGTKTLESCGDLDADAGRRYPCSLK